MNSDIPWDLLISRVEGGKLLPIIGDRVSSQLIFDHQKFVQAWSDRINYPLGGSFNVNRLAQFLSIKYDRLAAKEQYLKFSKEHLLETADASDGDKRSAVLKGRRLKEIRLSELAADLGQTRYPDGSPSSLALLAQLPLPIYCTTSYHNFLEQALLDAGKKPRVEICYWDEGLENIQAQSMGPHQLAKIRSILLRHFDMSDLKDIAFELGIEFEDLEGEARKDKARELVTRLNKLSRLPELVAIGKRMRPRADWSGALDQLDAEPSADEPLIYHLYGLDSNPPSMVLTENDHLDFLVSLSTDRPVIPLIKDALTTSSLVLLGYSLQEWDFRVLFRGLIAQRQRLQSSISVAIQLEPTMDEFGQKMDLPKAKEFLSRYFGKVLFEVYWGNSHNFVQELWDHWDQR